MKNKLSKQEINDLLNGAGDTGSAMPTSQFKAMLMKHYMGLGHKYDKAKEIVDALCKKHGIS